MQPAQKAVNFNKTVIPFWIVTDKLISPDQAAKAAGIDGT